MNHSGRPCSAPPIRARSARSSAGNSRYSRKRVSRGVPAPGRMPLISDPGPRRPGSLNNKREQPMKTLLPLIAGAALSLTYAAIAQPSPTPTGPKPPPAPLQAPATPKPVDLSTPTLFVVGYAHLDTQWRWTYIDTIREYIPAT